MMVFTVAAETSGNLKQQEQQLQKETAILIAQITDFNNKCN